MVNGSRLADRRAATRPVRAPGRAVRWGVRGATVAALVALAACQTQLAIPEDLAPAEFFQRAQDASSSRNYRAALRYYEEFRTRFGDDQGEVVRQVWVEYEIAFLHHKLGNDTLAIEQLEGLLTRYAEPAAAAWPRGPETLARRVLAELRAPATDADNGSG